MAPWGAWPAASSSQPPSGSELRVQPASRGQSGRARTLPVCSDQGAASLWDQVSGGRGGRQAPGERCPCTEVGGPAPDGLRAPGPGPETTSSAGCQELLPGTSFGLSMAPAASGAGDWGCSLTVVREPGLQPWPATLHAHRPLTAPSCLPRQRVPTKCSRGKSRPKPHVSGPHAFGADATLGPGSG